MNNNPTPVLDNDAIYLGDNGRCFCGKHAGATAKFTGRDISGQSVHRINVTEAEEFAEEFGVDFACESCGATV